MATLGKKQWKWIQFSSALKVSSLVWPLLHKLFGDLWKILLLRCGRTWFSVKSSIGFVQNRFSGALRGRALIFNHLNIIECKVFCNIFVLCKRRERCGGVGLARSVGEAIFYFGGLEIVDCLRFYYTNRCCRKFFIWLISKIFYNRPLYVGES